MKTMARLRTKFGGYIEDIDLSTIREFTTKDREVLGWAFISEFTNLPKEIIKRYSMIYIPDVF